jgi:hypothetical protein
MDKSELSADSTAATTRRRASGSLSKPPAESVT